MSIVIDASALTALALEEPKAGPIARQLKSWQTQRQQLHAPTLIRYEIANALTQAIARDRITAEKAQVAHQDLLNLPIELHDPDDDLQIVEIATRMKRSSAYDAAYIALTKRLGAELWTLDGPLKRNAETLGYPIRIFN